MLNGQKPPCRISGERIPLVASADDGERVTYTIKKYCEDGARKDETIPGVDFVKWFTWNILPFRFWRVRSRGFLAACNKKKSLEAIRAQIGESSPPPEGESEDTSGGEDDAYELKSPRCRKCGAEQMTWLDEVPSRVA